MLRNKRNGINDNNGIGVRRGGNYDSITYTPRRRGKPFAYYFYKLLSVLRCIGDESENYSENEDERDTSLLLE